MSKLESHSETGIEHNVLSRRQLLQAVPPTTAALLLSQFRSTIALAQEPKDKEKEESARRRLAHLKHVLHPPKEESYSVDDEVVKLKVNNRHFAFSVPKDSSPEKSSLWKVVPYDKKKPVTNVGSESGRTIYLAPRSYLAGEDTEKKLQESAQSGTLPPMHPTWMHKGDNLVVPMGTISLKPSSPDKKDEILAFAKENGLKFVDDKDAFMRFELPPSTSKFTSPFEAVRAMLKEKTVKWCEPDSAFKLRYYDDSEKKR